MKLMIRAHDLAARGENDIVKRLDELSLDGVQLVAYKSIEGVAYEKGSLSKERAGQIGDTLKRCGKSVALIGAYFNPVHPNEAKIQKGIDVFSDYLSLTSHLGCDVVGSETGSYMGDPWGYHPDNRTAGAQTRVVEVFTALADTVDKDGNTYEISVNTSCVHGWSDKYGFEFNSAQLQEFLWLKNEDGEIDVEKLTELIEDGKIKASMSASGKNGIRDIIKSLKPTDNTDGTDGNTDGTDGNTDGANGDDNTPISVQYEPTSNKSKAVAIQTILNSIEDETFIKNKMVVPFIEFLGEYIKNSK